MKTGDGKLPIANKVHLKPALLIVRPCALDEEVFAK
jgi:hypothetical protein